MSRVVSFAPNKLVRMYLDRAGADLKITSPSLLMNKIVADYFLMQYGEDERKKMRTQYIEEHLKDF